MRYLDSRSNPTVESAGSVAQDQWISVSKVCGGLSNNISDIQKIFTCN